VTLQPSRVTLQPSQVTLQPSRVTLQPSRVTLQPSQVTLQPSPVTLQPSRVTLQPSRVTLQSSRVTLQPSQVTLQPSQVTIQASQVTIQSSIVRPGSDPMAQVERVLVTRSATYGYERFLNTARKGARPSFFAKRKGLAPVLLIGPDLSFFSSVQPEPHLHLHLVLGDFAVGDAAAELGDFEPVDVAERLGGALDAGGDGFLERLARGTDDLHELVNLV
jgi:hypothetical protein